MKSAKNTKHVELEKIIRRYQKDTNLSEISTFESIHVTVHLISQILGEQPSLLSVPSPSWTSLRLRGLRSRSWNASTRWKVLWVNPKQGLQKREKWDDMMTTWWWHDDDMIMTWWWHYDDMMTTWWWHDDMIMTWWWHYDDMMMTWWWHDDDMIMTWWWHCDDMMMTWWQHDDNMMMTW